jgi:hypothetical protein
MRIRRIAAGQDGVVTRAQARAVGLSRHDVDGLCRSGRWRPLARTVYLIDAEFFPEAPRPARIRAAMLSLGRDAVAVLGTAAELHGISGLRRTDEIHVSLPGAAAKAVRTSDPAISIHQLVLPASAVSAVRGIATTCPLRTVADIILRVDRYPAVSVLDSALNRQLIGADDLAAMPALIRGRRGAIEARRRLGEADGRAESPLETRTRLRCVDGRVPPDDLQTPVRDDDGHLLAVGDLGWRRARVIAEADGRDVHGTPDAVFQDRLRQNRIVNAGWVVLRFTWADTMRPDYIPHVVRAALASRRPPGRPRD